MLKVIRLDTQFGACAIKTADIEWAREYPDSDDRCIVMYQDQEFIVEMSIKDFFLYWLSALEKTLDDIDELVMEINENVH